MSKGAAATLAWNANAGFTPVGTVALPFNGTFDGLGHTIAHLTINLPATADVGLFGSTDTASVIRNVGLIGGNVLALSSAGGLGVMTNIPPANEVYMVDVYEQFFNYSRYGYGSAMLVVFFFVIVAMTALIFRFLGRGVFYTVDPTKAGK